MHHFLIAITMMILGFSLVEAVQPPANLPIPQDAEPPEPTKPADQANAQIITRFLAQPMAGQPCTMEFTLKNPGQVSLGDIQLRQNWNIPVKVLEVEPKPSIQGNQWVWDILELPPGTGKVITATISFEGNVLPVFRPTLTYSANPSPEKGNKSDLFVQVQGPQFVRKGNKAVFDIIVGNQGKAPVHQVTIRDKLPEGLRHPEGDLIEADLGNIPPGGKKSIRLETLAVQSGKFSQDIHVASSSGDKRLYQSEISVGENLIQLKWVKSQENPNQGTLEMILEAQFESGTKKPENHLLNVTIPKGLELLDTVPAAGKVTPQSGETLLQWQNPPLLPGGKFFARFKLRAAQPGDWKLLANASMANSQDTDSSFLIRIEGTTEISGGFFNPKVETQQGKDFQIKFILHNQGSASGQNQSARFQIPDGLFPVNWKGPTVGGVEGNWILFDPLAKIGAGEKQEYLLEFRCLRPGDFQILAEFGNGTVTKSATCLILATPQP